MKLKLLIALPFLFLSTDLIAQETKDLTASSEDSNVRIDADWRVLHEDRMKLYGNVAGSLNDATSISDPESLAESISASAAKLPAISFHAINLRKIAASLSKPGSTVQTKTGSDAVDEVRAKLQEISRQLAFQPTLETEMPVGFPAPTPVGEIEVKSYPEYRLARTKLEGEPMDGKDSQSFFRLFNHIQSKDIAMTAPVEMTYQKSEAGVNESTMGFLYRNTEIGETDKEGEVEVVDVPSRKVISMGFRGRPDKKELEQAVELIRAHSLTLAAKFELSAEVIVLGYNGPSVPAENQFYEVQLKLKKKPAKRKVSTS